jgi:hypothetical protein
MSVHVISAQANVSEANVKRSGRSQNYMPPEAAAAIKEAQKTVVKWFGFATPAPAED